MDTLQKKVATFKIIARDALRMRLITPRLSKIAGIQSAIDNTVKHIDEVNLDIKVEQFEFEEVSSSHPRYEAKKEASEAAVKDMQAHVDELQKGIEEATKDIDKLKEDIAKIESGETKVSLDDLNAMVEDLIAKDAENQVS